jgi:uncharacterized protein (UPF0332 family)
MSPDAADLWARARKARQTSARLVDDDPDAAASRAYYAAFYAVSALLALQGRTFTRHTAIEAAVHRDLVKPGLWPVELGRAFSELVASRYTGDYGGALHVSPDEARELVRQAESIIAAVRAASPEPLPPVS